MAIKMSDAKKSPRHAGVYILPNKRLLARAVVRMPDGSIKTLIKTLPEGASEADAAKLVEALQNKAINPPMPKEPQQQPEPKPTPSATVKVCFEDWLVRRSRELKRSAAETYEAAWSLHIKPQIGDLPFAELNRASLEDWVHYAQNKRDASGKLYAQDTMRQWKRVLWTAIKDICADLRFDYDPTFRVKPPARPQQAPVREQRTLTADELADLIEAARLHTPDRYAEITVLCLTGMRAGELYGLKWDCVDFHAGNILIQRSASRNLLSPTTKTKAQRTVPMNPLLVDLLSEHRRTMIANQVKGLETGLVFPPDVVQTGEKEDEIQCRDAHSLDKAFAKLEKVLGTDINLGAQVLRRSMNSNLLRQATDRLIIRDIMGHTSEQMTARYYGAGDAEKRAAILSMPVRRETTPAPTV